MKRTLVLSCALVVVVACSSSESPEPGSPNQPSSPSENPPQHDGDPATPTIQDPDADVDLGGDNGAIEDTDPAPDGDIDDPGDSGHGDPGPGDPPPPGDPLPPIGDPPPPSERCDSVEVDVPLQMPWRHWPEGETIPYDQNPPAGGQSYEMWAQYR
jgi:hypothetical protein